MAVTAAKTGHSVSRPQIAKSGENATLGTHTQIDADAPTTVIEASPTVLPRFMRRATTVASSSAFGVVS
jgi:hypothetical protein